MCCPHWILAAMPTSQVCFRVISSNLPACLQMLWPSFLQLWSHKCRCHCSQINTPQGVDSQVNVCTGSHKTDKYRIWGSQRHWKMKMSETASCLLHFPFLWLNRYGWSSINIYLVKYSLGTLLMGQALGNQWGQVSPTGSPNSGL